MQTEIYEVIDVDADDSDIEFQGYGSNRVTVQEPANIGSIDLTLGDEQSDDGSRAGSAMLRAGRAPLKRAGSSTSQAAPPTKRRKEQAMESVARPAHRPSSKRPHSNAPHEVSDERAVGYSDGEPPIKRSRYVEATISTLERTSSSRVKDVVMIVYDINTEDEEEMSSSVVADYASADDASDSEREYETLYDALNPKMKKNWLPPKPHVSPRPLRKRDEDLLALNLAAMTVSLSSDNLVKERKKQDKGQVRGFRLPPDLLSLERGRSAYRGSSFVWTETSALRRRYQLSNSSFKLLRGLRASRVAHASGSVVKIVQHGPMVAIASAVLGGSGDDETDRLNRQYNQAGSLMLWSNGKGYTLHAHRRPWTENGALSTHTPRISNYLQTESDLLHTSNVVLHSGMQYMTTEDVQFNPLRPTRMASCGADGIVQLWDCDQIIEDDMLLPIGAVPLDNCKAKNLAYKPDGCALAVSAFDGNIYVQQDSAERSSSITLPLGRDAYHTTTDMTWGRKSSSHILYASSASCSIQEMAGCHKAFDVNSGDVICELDAQEAGQRLAVNEIGETVVLATQGPGMSFCLRKYDARRRLGRAVERTMLEPFTEKGSHKVNHMAFSPDGVYIAIARTDNTAHVYDARFLGKDVLHVFAHEDGSTAQSGRHGVVTAQWVDGFPRGLGLVTGGADGCVKLWDVRRSTDDPFNGNPIAECDYGISDFVTGDIRKGEHPLIVGECSGQVNVFR